MASKPLPACQRLAADKIAAMIEQARRGDASPELWAGIAGYARMAQAEAVAHAPA